MAQARQLTYVQTLQAYADNFLHNTELYALALQALEETRKVTPKGSELYEHIRWWCDENGFFGMWAIGKKLALTRTWFPYPKALAIGKVNGSHGGSYGPITPETDLSPFLHLGTTRIYTKDGKIDSDRSNALFANSRKVREQKENFLTPTAINDFLTAMIAKDEAVPDQKDDETGRHAFACPIVSRQVQHAAATGAWMQMFELLACTYIINDKGSIEAAFSEKDIDMFFRDTPKTMLKIQCGLLPVPRPKNPQQFNEFVAWERDRLERQNQPAAPSALRRNLG